MKNVLTLSNKAMVPIAVLRRAYKIGFTDGTKESVLLQAYLEEATRQREKEIADK
jgi:hypothetical protein